MPRTPDEIRERIRSLVKEGATKYKASQIIGIPYNTVKDLTKDLPSKPSNRIPEETRQKVRELVLSGKTKSETSAITGVKYFTVKYLTLDLPNRRQINDEKKKRARELVESGASRYQASKHLNISYPAVINACKDLPFPNARISLSHRSIDLLKELIQNGYTMPDSSEYTAMNHSILKSLFPIRTVHINGKKICFLENRSEDALRQYMEAFGNRVNSYNKYKELVGVFGVNQ
ncbi:MAG: hypothetical protein HY831_04090 [Candidatus Aenigmarchaeota archaeon]|nr:hypothetical protein [Candidatus Aenigmarchaeota archaeon]